MTAEQGIAGEFCSCRSRWLPGGVGIPAVPEKRLGKHTVEGCTFDGLAPRYLAAYPDGSVRPYPTLMDYAASTGRPPPAVSEIVKLMTEQAPYLDPGRYPRRPPPPRPSRLRRAWSRLALAWDVLLHGLPDDEDW